MSLLDCIEPAPKPPRPPKEEKALGDCCRALIAAYGELPPNKGTVRLHCRVCVSSVVYPLPDGPWRIDNS